MKKIKLVLLFIAIALVFCLSACQLGVAGKGDDGLTPYVGINGNWWIGNTDTGVRAQADEGLSAYEIYKKYYDYDGDEQQWINDLVNGLLARFTVTFDSNGGSSVEPIKDIKYDNLIAKPAEPLRDGYYFTGWFYDVELTREWDFASDTVTKSLTLYAGWESEPETEGLLFTLINNDTEYEVSKGSADTRGRVVIPYYHNGKPVTAIARDGFTYCDLTSIYIPNTITSIGDWAFYRCSSLTNIKIPNLITSIGNYIFYYCSLLTNIKIPNSVTSIGDSAFDYCSLLTSIIIPNSVTSIGNSAFYRCSSLTSVTIPDSVTSIGNYAFSWCSSLTSITIPNSVTSIGEYAFANCGLTSITIPDSVISIGNYAFSDCYNLTIIKISNRLTSIGDWAFAGCSKLTEIAIPNSVEYIGDYSFASCSSLTSVIMSNKVTRIGDWAFSNCSKLTTVYYSGSNISAWNNITNGISNEYLIGANIYIYAASQPQGGGKYWYYDTDGVTPVKW